MFKEFYVSSHLFYLLLLIEFHQAREGSGQFFHSAYCKLKMISFSLFKFSLNTFSWAPAPGMEVVCTLSRPGQRAPRATGEFEQTCKDWAKVKYSFSIHFIIHSFILHTSVSSSVFRSGGIVKDISTKRSKKAPPRKRDFIETESKHYYTKSFIFKLGHRRHKFIIITRISEHRTENALYKQVVDKGQSLMSEKLPTHFFPFI